MDRVIAPVILFGLVLAFGGFPDPAIAQGTAAPVVQAELSLAESVSGFDTLHGRWVRPDGGYEIDIKGVDASGKLDAEYANSRPLPFAKAEALRDGNTINLFFELRASGYNGST